MWKPTISSDEIWHHGIQGMHWGQRNGPPYPLSAGEHNKVVKGASKKSKVGGGKTTSVKKKKTNPVETQGGIPEKKESKPLSNNMSDVEKKHELKENDYSNRDHAYVSYHSKKHDVDIDFWTDDGEPSPKQLDEVLSNYEKVNHKEIMDNAKNYMYESIKKNNPEYKDLDYKQFSKAFDRDYKIGNLYVTTFKDEPIVQLSIWPKGNSINPWLGDHEVNGEFDKTFKRKPQHWSMDG